MAAILKFETSDKQIIECNKDDIVPFAKNIETLLNEGKITTDTPYTLEKVNAESLNKVLAYIVQYKAEQAKKPAQDEKMEENKENKDDEDAIKVEDWELEFVKDLSNATLLDLVNASEELLVDSLWTASCMKIANSLKGKTTEQMREDWQIENDFTPEEEEALIQETKWMED